MIYGANTQHLRDLATAISNESDRLLAVEQRLSNTVATSGWEGADAVRFRDSWSNDQRLKIRSASELLSGAAKLLRQNADEQDRASDAASPETLSIADGIGAMLYGDPTLEVPGLGSSREDVEAWWNSLTDEQREAIVDRDPSAIGNLDGVPLEARFEANVEAVDRELARLRQEVATFKGGDPDALLQMIRDMEALETIGREGSNVLYFQTPGDGRGYEVALALGDLENATEVAVTVSGTGSDLSQYAHNFYPETVGLVDYDKGRAAIATLVWNTPEGGLIGTAASNTTIENYTGSFVNGPISSILSTAQAEFGNITLVGHSAGAIAVQEFVTSGVPAAEYVNGVALLAPPALNPDLVEAMNGDRIFVAMNSDDPLRFVDGDEKVTNGLGWEQASIQDVIDGKEPWNRSSVDYDVQTSGSKGISLTGPHGNSFYFDNYEGGIDWTFGRLGETDLDYGNYA